VAEPANGDREAGSHDIPFNASDLPGGMYLCRLEARSVAEGVGEGFVRTVKMLLVR
jgi:hypothetical protein